MTGSITGWVKLFIKRYAFGVKIKQVCKKKGFELYKNGSFWWLGRNNSGKYNFTVKCYDENFCVKLVGVRSKRILYGFIDEYSYEIKDYTFALPHTMDSFDYVVKNKEPYQFMEETVPCIVMIPESVKVTIRNQNAQNNRMEIGSGDKVIEGSFFFGDKFLQLLNEK